jgi:hypothetical protein
LDKRSWKLFASPRVKIAGKRDLRGHSPHLVDTENVAGGVLIQFLGAKLISSRCFKLKEHMRIKQGRYRDESARGSVLRAIELLYS